MWSSAPTAVRNGPLGSAAPTERERADVVIGPYGRKRAEEVSGPYGRKRADVVIGPYGRKRADGVIGPYGVTLKSSAPTGAKP